MAFEFSMEQEVNYSMTSSISLLHSVAIQNAEKDLNGVFVDLERKVALAGGRRQTANFGTVLVKATYGESASKILLPNGEEKMYGKGMYNFETKLFHEDQPGLLGGEAANGDREIVDVDIANEKINDVIGQVAMQHKALFSPNTMYTHIKKIIGDTEKANAYMDKKINIQFVASEVPKDQFVAMLFPDDGGRMVVKIVINGEGGTRVIPVTVMKDSPYKQSQMKPDRYYIVEPKGIDRKTGERFVHVLRPLQFGIRSAIQHIKNGTKRPGSYGYMLDAQEEAGVKKTSIFTMFFAKEQDKKFVSGSPMLTIDLDNFAALMTVFKGYEQVEMQFKDSSTGIYLRAQGDTHRPYMEAILSPTIQYVNGKTCLR